MQSLYTVEVHKNTKENYIKDNFENFLQIWLQ